jgi:hypothetical protein
VSRWPERVWAIEGSNGAGRPLVQRLLADGDHVVDVPANLPVWARLFNAGHNRKPVAPHFLRGASRERFSDLPPHRGPQREASRQKAQIWLSSCESRQ